MKDSVFFASKKHFIQDQILTKIEKELIPQYNDEIARINLEYRLNSKFHPKEATIRRRKATLALAKAKNDVLNPLKIMFHLEIEELIKKGNGKIVEDRVHFPDGTDAHIPKGLWIDYSKFKKA